MLFPRASKENKNKKSNIRSFSPYFSQEFSAQSKFNGPHGTAEAYMVLAGAGREDVRDEGQGRGELPELREDPRQDGVKQPSRLLDKRVQANVQELHYLRRRL